MMYTSSRMCDIPREAVNIIYEVVDGHFPEDNIKQKVCALKKMHTLHEVNILGIKVYVLEGIRLLEKVCAVHS